MISILFSSINYLIDIFYLIIPIYTINMLRYIYNDSLIMSTLKALFIFISIIIRDIFIFGVGYIIAILIY